MYAAHILVTSLAQRFPVTAFKQMQHARSFIINYSSLDLTDPQVQEFEKKFTAFLQANKKVRLLSKSSSVYNIKKEFCESPLRLVDAYFFLREVKRELDELKDSFGGAYKHDEFRTVYKNTIENIVRIQDDSRWLAEYELHLKIKHQSFVAVGCSQKNRVTLRPYAYVDEVNTRGNGRA
jgi:hypothetical protein